MKLYKVYFIPNCLHSVNIHLIKIEGQSKVNIVNDRW